MNKIKSTNAISLFALVVSLVSLLMSVKQCDVTSKVNYLHVEPTLECHFYQDQDSASFIVKNDSPIRVVSLSIGQRICMYGEEAGKYIFQMTYGDSVLDTPGTKWIFKPHLVPNGIIDKNINTSYPGFKLHPPSTVIVRIFDVEYYRESDMKRYFKRAIFFVTGERVFNYSQALDVEVLQKPIEQLENYINEGDSIMEKRRSEYEKRQKAQ